MSEVVIGLKEMQRALKRFPKNVQKNIVTGATRAGASFVAKEAKKNVPVRTGTLKRSIKVSKSRTRDKNEILFKVKAGGKVKYTAKGEKHEGDAFYAQWVEYGTSKTAAHPFMRPAMVSSVDDISRIFKEYFVRRVDKEIEKAKNA